MHHVKALALPRHVYVHLSDPLDGTLMGAKSGLQLFHLICVAIHEYVRMWGLWPTHGGVYLLLLLITLTFTPCFHYQKISEG